MGATLKESELRQDATAWRRGPTESAAYLARWTSVLIYATVFATVAGVVVALAAAVVLVLGS